MVCKNGFRVYSNRNLGVPVDVKIDFNEKELRQLAKEAGAHWNNDRKSWRLPYSEAIKLGLINRIMAPKD